MLKISLSILAGVALSGSIGAIGMVFHDLWTGRAQMYRERHLESTESETEVSENLKATGLRKSLMSESHSWLQAIWRWFGRPHDPLLNLERQEALAEKRAKLARRYHMHERSKALERWDVEDVEISERVPELERLTHLELKRLMYLEEGKYTDLSEPFELSAKVQNRLRKALRRVRQKGGNVDLFIEQFLRFLEAEIEEEEQFSRFLEVEIEEEEEESRESRRG